MHNSIPSRIPGYWDILQGHQRNSDTGCPLVSDDPWMGYDNRSGDGLVDDFHLNEWDRPLDLSANHVEPSATETKLHKLNNIADQLRPSAPGVVNHGDWRSREPDLSAINMDLLLGNEQDHSTTQKVRPTIEPYTRVRNGRKLDLTMSATSTSEYSPIVQPGKVTFNTGIQAFSSQQTSSLTTPSNSTSSSAASNTSGSVAHNFAIPDPMLTHVLGTSAPGVPVRAMRYRRRRFSADKESVLWSAFRRDPYCSKNVIKLLADCLGLGTGDVKQWFASTRSSIRCRVGELALRSFDPHGGRTHPILTTNPLVSWAIRIEGQSRGRGTSLAGESIAYDVIRAQISVAAPHTDAADMSTPGGSSSTGLKL